MALWLVGRCLDLLRTARGISQVEAGAAIGSSVRIIRGIETGTRPVRPGELTALCRLYQPSAAVEARLRSLAADSTPLSATSAPPPTRPPPTRAARSAR
ncbi:helix-turn-helix domain-containing protein [Plantactinospora mayteni]|uniref:helix-turn-helix domain-containing protein n=1 Tax=Plantactinospora mayteni TaxID=566021 RepID=UPI001942B71F